MSERWGKGGCEGGTVGGKNQKRGYGEWKECVKEERWRLESKREQVYSEFGGGKVWGKKSRERTRNKLEKIVCEGGKVGGKKAREKRIVYKKVWKRKGQMQELERGGWISGYVGGKVGGKKLREWGWNEHMKVERWEVRKQGKSKKKTRWMEKVTIHRKDRDERKTETGLMVGY